MTVDKVPVLLHNRPAAVAGRLQTEVNSVSQPVHGDLHDEVGVSPLDPPSVGLHEGAGRHADPACLAVLRNISHQEGVCRQQENCFSGEVEVHGVDVLVGLGQQSRLLPHAGADGDVLAVEVGADGEDDEGRLVVTVGAGGAGHGELLLARLGLPTVVDGGEVEEVGGATEQGPRHVPLLGQLPGGGDLPPGQVRPHLGAGVGAGLLLDVKLIRQTENIQEVGDGSTSGAC